MSKHKKNLNETVNEVVETVEGEVEEMTEKDEKKNIVEKVAEGIGHAAGCVAKVATSKPAKIAAVVGGLALSAKVGYERGRKKASASASIDSSALSNETNFNEVETPVSEEN